MSDGTADRPETDPFQVALQQLAAVALVVAVAVGASAAQADTAG